MKKRGRVAGKVVGKNEWGDRKEAMLRAIVIDGKKFSEVMETFRCSNSTLSTYRLSQIWKEKEAAMREDVYSQHKGRLASLVGPSIDAVEETVVKCQDQALKVKTAFEVLDRTGFPKGLQIETEMKPVINLFMPVHLRAALGVGVVEGEVVKERDEEEDG